MKTKPYEKLQVHSTHVRSYVLLLLSLLPSATNNLYLLYSISAYKSDYNNYLL